jgi:hypothetical protein
MFDDLESAEHRTDEAHPSSKLYRWAHIPAILVIALLIVLLRRHSWGWQIAIVAGYTVFVFWLAFGSVLHDADDFFGDPRVPRYAARMLVPHVLALVLLVSGVTLWFRLRPVLPEWVTQEGHKGSFWDLFGWMVLSLGGIAEGFWMGERLKRLFEESGDR